MSPAAFGRAFAFFGARGFFFRAFVRAEVKASPETLNGFQNFFHHNCVGLQAEAEYVEH